MPCSRTSLDTFARPAAATWSRQGEIARMPLRTQASMISGSGRSAPLLLRMVAVLIDSQRWSWAKSRMVDSGGSSVAPPLADDRGVVEITVAGGNGVAHQLRMRLRKRQRLAGGFGGGQHQADVL